MRNPVPPNIVDDCTISQNCDLSTLNKIDDFAALPYTLDGSFLLLEKSVISIRWLVVSIQ